MAFGTAITLALVLPPFGATLFVWPFFLPVIAVFVVGATLGQTLMLAYDTLLGTTLAVLLALPFVAFLPRIVPIMIVETLVLAFVLAFILRADLRRKMAVVMLISYTLDFGSTPLLVVWSMVDIATGCAVAVLVLLLPFPRTARNDMRLTLAAAFRAEAHVLHATMSAFLSTSVAGAAAMRAELVRLIMALREMEGEAASLAEQASWEPRLPRSATVSYLNSIVQGQRAVNVSLDAMVCATRRLNVSRLHAAFVAEMAGPLMEMVEKLRVVLERLATDIEHQHALSLSGIEAVQLQMRRLNRQYELTSSRLLQTMRAPFVSRFAVPDAVPPMSPPRVVSEGEAQRDFTVEDKFLLDYVVFGLAGVLRSVAHLPASHWCLQKHVPFAAFPVLALRRRLILPAQPLPCASWYDVPVASSASAACAARDEADVEAGVGERGGGNGAQREPRAPDVERALPHAEPDACPAAPTAVEMEAVPGGEEEEGEPGEEEGEPGEEEEGEPGEQEVEECFALPHLHYYRSFQRGGDSPARDHVGQRQRQPRRWWPRLRRTGRQSFSRLRALLHGRVSAEDRQCARDSLKLCVAILLSSITVFVPGLAELFPFGIWAPISVVFATGPSVGGSMEQTLRRLEGTMAGALVGYLAITLPFGFLPGTVIILTVWVFITGYARVNGPLWYAALTAAFTAPLVAVGPMTEGADPVDFALARVLQTLFGLAVLVLVTNLLWPARASNKLRVLTLHTSDALLECCGLLFDTFTRGWQDLPAPVDICAVTGVHSAPTRDVQPALAALSTIQFRALHSTDPLPPPALYARLRKLLRIERLLDRCMQVQRALLFDVRDEPALWRRPFPREQFVALSNAQQELLAIVRMMDWAMRCAVATGGMSVMRQRLQQPMLRVQRSALITLRLVMHVLLDSAPVTSLAALRDLWDPNVVHERPIQAAFVPAWLRPSEGAQLPRDGGHDDQRQQQQQQQEAEQADEALDDEQGVEGQAEEPEYRVSQARQEQQEQEEQQSAAQQEHDDASPEQESQPQCESETGGSEAGEAAQGAEARGGERWAAAGSQPEHRVGPQRRRQWQRSGDTGRWSDPADAPSPPSAAVAAERDGKDQPELFRASRRRREVQGEQQREAEASRSLQHLIPNEPHDVQRSGMRGQPSRMWLQVGRFQRRLLEFERALEDTLNQLPKQDRLGHSTTAFMLNLSSFLYGMRVSLNYVLDMAWAAARIHSLSPGGLRAVESGAESDGEEQDGARGASPPHRYSV